MMHANRTGYANARAHISAATGAFVLPVVTPYEWQVFCEHLAAAARQRGTVEVRIGAVRCEVRLCGRDRVRRHCASCACPLSSVAFRMTYRDLCLRCARLCLAEHVVDRTDAAAL